MRSSSKKLSRLTLNLIVILLFFHILLVEDNQVQILGKVIKNHSKLYGMPIENYYYISVCLKIGNCYIDMKANECKDPFWTISDVNDKTKGIGQRGQSKFKVIKNGIHFVYTKQANGTTQNLTAEQEEMHKKIFLDQIVLKVQILPQKFKIIKTPIHLYGELVKTQEGVNYLRQTQDYEYFKNEIFSSDSTLNQKRAALWAIGHIASSDYGIKLLLEDEFVKDIIKLANSSDILSLRGYSLHFSHNIVLASMCQA